MSLLRPRRMLRRFGPCARAGAFQRNRSPADCVPRSRRDLGLVLYSSPLLRSRAAIATQEALCAGERVGTFLQAITYAKTYNAKSCRWHRCFVCCSRGHNYFSVGHENNKLRGSETNACCVVGDVRRIRNSNCYLSLDSQAGLSVLPGPGTEPKPGKRARRLKHAFERRAKRRCGLVECRLTGARSKARQGRRRARADRRLGGPAA